MIAAIPASASAGDDVTEVWGAFWDTGQCTLILSYDSDDMAGDVEIQRPCGGLMRGIRSFAYTDESASEIVLFSRRGQRGDLIGSLSDVGGDVMEGFVGDGEPVAMELIEAYAEGNGGGGNTGGSGACVQYADGGCVDSADRSNPNIRFGSTLDMFAHADLDIFPFSGGSGFKKDEYVAHGECRQVKRCDSRNGEDWCEVVLSDGFFTGWVKRQAKGKVYLSQGC